MLLYFDIELFDVEIFDVTLLMLHCIKVTLGSPYLMLNAPLFHIVLVAVEIDSVTLFSVALF